ncbi:MAG TPA: hypothetical protein VGR02_17015, partial [Thermoanaerobaculia bacterium]|nr:hypothetical protein [Thermoanaerobaculia bacterium]
MRVKQDAIPGMEVPVHFKPVKLNTYQWEIACAQLCGLGHYRMRGMLTVHNHADFQAWLKSQAPEDTAAPEPNPVPAATPAEPTTTAHT